LKFLDFDAIINSYNQLRNKKYSSAVETLFFENLVDRFLLNYNSYLHIST